MALCPSLPIREGGIMASRPSPPMVSALSPSIREGGIMASSPSSSISEGGIMVSSPSPLIRGGGITASSPSPRGGGTLLFSLLTCSVTSAAPGNGEKFLSLALYQERVLTFLFLLRYGENRRKDTIKLRR